MDDLQKRALSLINPGETMKLQDFYKKVQSLGVVDPRHITELLVDGGHLVRIEADFKKGKAAEIRRPS